RSETVHIVNVNEAAGRTDDESLARGKINAGHVGAGFQGRCDSICLKIDNGYRFVPIVRSDPILPVVTHVNTPWVFSDLDGFDDLVLTGIDHTYESQIAIGSVQITSIRAKHGDIDSVDFPEVFIGVQYRNAGHFPDLDLLQ